MSMWRIENCHKRNASPSSGVNDAGEAGSVRGLTGAADFQNHQFIQFLSSHDLVEAVFLDQV